MCAATIFFCFSFFAFPDLMYKIESVLDVFKGQMRPCLKGLRTSNIGNWHKRNQENVVLLFVIIFFIIGKAHKLYRGDQMLYWICGGWGTF